MAVRLSPIWSGTQFFNSAGQPLNGGKILQYTAGTTTNQATYTDSTGTVQNANPIILDSTGRYSAQIWFTTGVNYKLVLQDSAGNTILTEDNLTGINDSAGAGVSEWVSFVGTPTYVSGTSFTVSGNNTTIFAANARVKSTLNSGSVYSTVTSSSFGGGVTTVNLLNDSTAIDNTLSAVAYGFLGTSNPSVPAYQPYVGFHAHLSSNQTSGNIIIFNTVDNQNGGTNYNSSTGIFTAPISGWYHFSVAIAIQNNTGGASTMNLSLYANSVRVSAFGYSNSSIVASANVATGSMSSTVFLSSGQQVNAQSDTVLSATYYANAGGACHFSGFLVS